MILPLKTLYAGAYIGGTATTSYNAKLPTIPIPDMDNFPLVQALPREYLRQLPPLNWEMLPSVAIPPLMEWPIISHISNITTMIPYNLTSQLLQIAYFILEYLFWVGCTILFSFAQRTDVSTNILIISTIFVMTSIVNFSEIPNSFTSLMLQIVYFISELLLWIAGIILSSLARSLARRTDISSISTISYNFLRNLVNGTPADPADDNKWADIEEHTNIASSPSATIEEVGEDKSSDSDESTTSGGANDEPETTNSTNPDISDLLAQIPVAPDDDNKKASNEENTSITSSPPAASGEVGKDKTSGDMNDESDATDPANPEDQNASGLDEGQWQTLHPAGLGNEFDFDMGSERMDCS